MTRLSRYIFIQTLIGVLAAAGVISAVILLIDFVETSRDIATRADISALQALQLSFLKAPLLVQDALPFMVLFGVLFTFFRLSRRSELIVMRASGYSAWRILAPAAVLTLVMGVLSATALNPLGSSANARFETLRDELLGGQTGEARGAAGEVWLREQRRDGFTIITADSLDPDTATLTSPVFRTYLVGDRGEPRLDRRIMAGQARLGGGFWTLDQALEARPGDTPVDLGAVSLPTTIGGQALFERARSPGATAFWDLPDVIESAREAGLSSLPYELRWHSLLAQPLVLMAAALLGVAATLRLHRMGGAAGFATAGAVAGFAMYFTQELLLGLGSSGALNPITASWTAPILFALGGLFFIAATEDG
jgi:lipopolysaccharide export system permease protein